MRKILILLLIGSSLFALSQESTTFILVRHAEKAKDGTKDPPLNKEGEKRAKKLSELLSTQEISALYSTPFQRTKETLSFIATHKGLPIQEYDPFSSEEWLESLLKSHRDGSIIISGHSNTIPSLVNSLIGAKKFIPLRDDEYGNIFIVVANELGKGSLIHLSY